MPLMTAVRRTGGGKHVFSYDKLDTEDKDNIVVLINDSKRYTEIKEKLESYGLVENKHFFNGWKLDFNFYKIVQGDKSWIEFEKEDDEALTRLRQGWKKRAKALSEMIPDDVNSMLDIGCGESLVKEFLPSRITYYGLDYCKRDDNTIVCNVNNESLPDLKVDLYYMAGILSYILDMPGFIKQLHGAKYVLMSTPRTDCFIRLDNRYIEDGYLNYGIVEYYLSNLITDMFEEGWVCRRLEWKYKERDEYYILFEKKTAV